MHQAPQPVHFQITCVCQESSVFCHLFVHAETIQGECPTTQAAKQQMMLCCVGHCGNLTSESINPTVSTAM